MKMVEVKTSELEGAVLDWAVAQTQGVETSWRYGRELVKVHDRGGIKLIESIRSIYSPSTDWSQGGPLIEKYGIRVSKDIAPDMGGKDWRADVMGRYNGLPKATSPLIALCRAVVIHELGDTVQVPADLIGGAA